ncbi:hypothetical protein BDP81DRAFT_417110 [Colletotrichum phormii]|uniref:Heterokaryon incompatibility domain-containing protein n=1 Tax=Colletotrichum phormii TaxID=359342 RepID=A0AAJ0EKX4_9PEZI|nr:uncharacterized protein BDP81DRAFT_417110 [Colletotrichum phormii]KAK1655022.1 hypothetical protein BDP81DRAFT_417110 [Colletotrichum phormii]
MTMPADDPPAYSPPSYASTIYTPLVQSNTIRVLTLYPALSHDAEVQCGLLSTEISTCQELEQSYVALSYVWGNLSDPQLVYVNDQEVYIGRNLFKALRHLRRRDRPIRLGQTRYVSTKPILRSETTKFIKCATSILLLWRQLFTLEMMMEATRHHRLGIFSKDRANGH